MIIPPAVLTNASAILASAASTRFGQVADNRQSLLEQLDKLGAGDASRERIVKRMHRLGDRARLLLRSMRVLFAAVGLFTASALIALLGAALALEGYTLAFRIATTLDLTAGLCAVLSLSYGCTLLMREATLTIPLVDENDRIARGEEGTER